MGIQRGADLHAVRPLDDLDDLAGRTSFYIRGVDIGDTEESATKGTEHSIDLRAVLESDMVRFVVYNAASAATPRPVAGLVIWINPDDSTQPTNKAATDLSFVNEA